LFLARQTPVDQALLIHEVSRSHAQRRITINRTPLDGWSARHRDLYLTTLDSHDLQTSMPPVGFELTSQQASGRRPTP